MLSLAIKCLLGISDKRRKDISALKRGLSIFEKIRANLIFLSDSFLIFVTHFMEYMNQQWELLCKRLNVKLV